MDIEAIAASLGVSTSAPAPAPAPVGLDVRVVVERLHQDPDLTPQQQKALMEICQTYMSKTIDKTTFYRKLVKLVGNLKVRATLVACTMDDAQAD
tara:strand:- start:1488 stop:1772 length:285 start_codon:yes stop_codon:yes gene_type:complete